MYMYVYCYYIYVCMNILVLLPSFDGHVNVFFIGLQNTILISKSSFHYLIEP